VARLYKFRARRPTLATPFYDASINIAMRARSYEGGVRAPSSGVDRHAETDDSTNCVHNDWHLSLPKLSARNILL